MKKPTWTIFLLTLFTLGSFAQTPEWTEYCQIRDEINHNDYLPENRLRNVLQDGLYL